MYSIFFNQSVKSYTSEDNFNPNFVLCRYFNLLFYDIYFKKNINRYKTLEYIRHKIQLMLSFTKIIDTL